MIFSVGVVYSASSYFSLDKFGDSMYMFRQHIIKVVFAILMIFVFAKIDYRYYQRMGKVLIWISIIFLIIIFVGGFISIKGAIRWLSLGPISFQPSDLAKYALVIYLSHLLVKKKDQIHLLYKGYLPLVFYILLISGLVLSQPNLSTAIVIFVTSLMMLILSPVKMKHIFYTVLSVIPFALLFVISKSYVLKRLTKHADYTDGGTSNYQLVQAIIGFGNGGFTGVGPGNSMQREYFLPEAYSDFIFSIVGEEYGFIGTFIIVCLFALFLYRGFKVAKTVNDDFGRYLAFGITSIISAYAGINMAVACGLVPTTGVPIPFLSYGGTALIINAIAVGILLNISTFRNKEEKSLNFQKKEDN